MQALLKDTQGITYFTIEHWPEKGILYASWFGSFVETSQVQAGAMLGLEFIKKTRANKLLNDNRELRGSWDEANEWLANVWMSQAIEAGLKRFAHIYSPDLYAKLSAEFMKENFEESATNTFQIKMFSGQQEAEDWLLSFHE